MLYTSSTRQLWYLYPARVRTQDTWCIPLSSMFEDWKRKRGPETKFRNQDTGAISGRDGYQVARESDGSVSHHHSCSHHCPVSSWYRAATWHESNWGNVCACHLSSSSLSSRFGKREEDFASGDEYNDYVEKREDLSKYYISPLSHIHTARPPG